MNEIQNDNYNNKRLNLLYIVIIILLIIIAILAFFIWKNYDVIFNWWKTITSNSTNTTNDIVVKIIWDKRCKDCYTAQISEQLKKIPSLAWAKFEEFDFNDEWIKDFIKENNIKTLPAFLFNTNNISDLKEYMIQTPTGLYSLNVWSTYDPYAKRSERGFLILNDWILNDIKKDSRIYGNENAEILWVEYSDLNCGYCAKLHNEGTIEALFNTFGDKLRLAYQYFAIFNKEAPIILECIAEQKGTNVMYETIKKAYKNGLRDKTWIAGVVEWLNDQELTTCINSGKYTRKIDAHMKMWSEIFGITWTPGNILINTKTLEYAKLPGAYPIADFEKTINNLLITK